MESISEWRSIVVEKKRLYEGEDPSPTPTPTSLQQQQHHQHFPSPPLVSSSSSSSISPTSSLASISVSASSYPAWKQKRKQAHNDINNLAVSFDDNNSLTTANPALLRSPNAPDPNSNDSFGNTNLIQSPDMSPISISSTAANADGSTNGGEKLIDDDRLIPVHDNPFFVKDGKKMIGQRIDKKDLSGQLDCSNDCNNINNRYDFTNSLDDTDMEYRPGSGFVSRLKDKFASMSTKEDVAILRPKRSSSVENLLDGRPKSHPFNGGDLRLTDTRRKLREGRAVSVENLNHTMDKSSPTSPLTLELKSKRDIKPKTKAEDSNSSASTIMQDRDIVIIEKTPAVSTPTPLSPANVEIKHQLCTAASIEEQTVDNELPKPNTVSSFRSLFENSKSNNNNEPVTSRVKGKAPIASSKVVTSASSDSLSSLSSSEKVKGGDSISVNHVHDKGKKTEGSVKRAEVTKPSSLDQLDLSSKDILSPKTPNTPTTLLTPLTPSSAPLKSPSLDRLSPANHVADSMKLNLTSRENDKLLDSESKENAEPVTENKTGTSTKNELNNRGLPSILMRKDKNDSGELGQVILRKTNSRALEEEDELKGRITYYPAGLNKSNNAVSSNYPTPKKRQAPKAPTPDNDSKILQSEDIVDYTLDNERVTINDISPTKRSGALEPLTPLDLSSITNNDIVEYQEGYIPTKIGPCKIQFIGADVKLERSCIAKTKTKKHKVCFRDSLSTLHDYPSEELMLEDYLEEHPEERQLLLDSHGFAEGNAESTDDGSESDDTSPNLHDGMMSNMALSSSGGLSTYRSKYQMDYEFGMQLEEHQPPPPPPPVEDTREVDIMQLRPADEKDLNSWSESSSSDILF